MKIILLLLTSVVLGFIPSPKMARIQGQQADPTPKIRRNSRAIPNRYIVVFEEWAVPRGDESKASLTAVEMTRANGGKVRRLFSRSLSAFSVEMSEDEAAALAETDRRVKYIEQDSQVSADLYTSPTPTQDTPNTLWGLDRVDQRDLPLDGAFSYEQTGEDVNVYVIDSGIRLTHHEFGGHASVAYDALLPEGDPGFGIDSNGHGTFVAGIIGGVTYGVAKGVRLYAVRALDSVGQGRLETVLAAIEWVTANHRKPALANMSLGSVQSETLDQAVKNSIAAGVTYVVSAGNQNEDACNRSPARLNEAITVGATTRDDQRADFSNGGRCVSIFAPGKEITSAFNSSDTSTSLLSGTSMAAPYVTGAAALYLQGHPAALPAAVKSSIVATATSGRLSFIKTGSPNLMLYSPLTSESGSPCPSCAIFGGFLAGPGGSAIQPNGSSFFSGAFGLHKGIVRSPSGTEFDLYLEYFDCSQEGKWMAVASSETNGSEQRVSFFGLPGTYRWRIQSRSGSGNYDFWQQQP